MFDVFAIFHTIRRQLQKRDWLILGAIIILFFITRIINLDKFPIFGDEGIYVHWAKVAWHDASWRFISLTDGKQPLQTWGTIPMLKLFPTNYILAGRMFSVATGLFALIGMILTSWYLFGKKTGIIAGFLYVFTPYFLFYDRMALVDSGVNAFAIWIFLFSIVLARTIRLDVALIFGLLSGLGLLAKSSARIFLGLGYLAGLIIAPHNSGKKNERFKHFFNFSILYLLSSIIALTIYNVQRLSPFLHFVEEKNKTFIMTGSEFMHNPFAYFFSNTKIVPYYVLSEMGYIVGLVGLVGLYMLYRHNKRLGLYFASWLVIPFFIVTLVSKVIFPRYLIFFASTLTILAAYTLTHLTDKKKILISWVLIVISVGYFDYTLVTDFKNIPFPPVDKGQYVEGITAGWGVSDIVAFAREKSRDMPVKLLAEGDFGVIGDQLDVYMYPNDKIELKGYWPLEIEQLKENQQYLNEKLIYAVFSHRQQFPPEWPIRLVKKYDKPGGQSSIYLYELTK